MSRQEEGKEARHKSPRYLEKCAPVFHQAEADPNDSGAVPDGSGNPSQRKLINS